jgi:hypothetical protein
MDAYLLSAGLTQSQIRPSPLGYEAMQTWDTCVSAIVYGGELEQAQTTFEAWCGRSPEGEKPVTAKIKRLVGAQFIEQLLTESGSQPLDWPTMAQRVREMLETTPADDFEQGYWVDANQVVPPEAASLAIESLERDLPEDIRSGLNWSPGKKFLFMVSVLSPPPAPAELDDDFEEDESALGEGEEENTREEDLDSAIAALPEMRDKEAAALVEARNSVVAAWLWRKFAAGTRLAANEIQISPLCGLFPAS